MLNISVMATTVLPAFFGMNLNRCGRGWGQQQQLQCVHALRSCTRPDTCLASCRLNALRAQWPGR
jgi:hypothetical protein